MTNFENVGHRVLLAVGCVVLAVVRSACNYTAKKVAKDNALLLENMKRQLSEIKNNQEITAEAVKNMNLRLAEHVGKQKKMTDEIHSIRSTVNDTEDLIRKLQEDAEKLPDTVKFVVKDYFVSLHNEHEQIYAAVSKNL